MSVRKTLKRGRSRVPTFRQETKRYCGPASAKMTLKWLGVSRTQNTLWDAIQDEADDLGLPVCESCPGSELCQTWSSPPEALAEVIRSRSQAPIKLVSEPNVAATDHAIVWSVLNDIPAVVLVQGWAHWVVVHGYHVDREPAGIQDTAYQLLGLDVIDPWPKTPARVFVDAAEWRADYLNGVPCGRFTGRFVAVCDPEPERPKGGPTVPQRSTTERKRGGAVAAKRDDVERMVPIERAQTAARAGIERAELMQDPTWRRAMRGAKPGAVQVVHRLDRPRQVYALVGFERRRTVTAQVQLNAYTGEMLSARAGENSARSLARAWSEEEIIELLMRRRWDLPGARPNLQLRREALVVSPLLVWKSCEESQSPYLPFIRVSYGDHAIYVRVDGEVFTRLTPPSPGG